jgi:hypothetical protein
MITKRDITKLLANSAVIGLPTDMEGDTELVIDSFTFAWIQHVLEEIYGLVIHPSGQDMESFTSADSIFEYLARHYPDMMESAGEAGDDG